jgi:hypothetical protein
MQLPKFSIGVGDRFAHQAKAQLAACICARERGLAISPVWNKSNREHIIVGSDPRQTRAAADAAVEGLQWRDPYFLDADHINLSTVDRFLDPCDFFTIDVADWIGKAAAPGELEKFGARHAELDCTPARKYLFAVQEAGRIYRKIADAKGASNFVTEVSMDETDSPQTPDELLVILAAIADERIPIQTIAPKFTGRFNKGVDYVGDVLQFEREFSADIAVIEKAVASYGLPGNLKLSVHSGSDKFSLYAPMRRVLQKSGAGVHLKTAGTTWLEEIIGLAESGGEALALCREIYAAAYDHRDELCAPYTAVIDIDPSRLPSPAEVNGWSSSQFAATVRHDHNHAAFNPSVRQLLHVGYKIAAQMGTRYTALLESCETAIARNVTGNLYDRHIVPLFFGS